MKGLGAGLVEDGWHVEEIVVYTTEEVPASHRASRTSLRDGSRWSCCAPRRRSGRSHATSRVLPGDRPVCGGPTTAAAVAATWGGARRERRSDGRGGRPYRRRRPGVGRPRSGRGADDDGSHLRSGGASATPAQHGGDAPARARAPARCGAARPADVRARGARRLAAGRGAARCRCSTTSTACAARRMPLRCGRRWRDALRRAGAARRDRDVRDRPGRDPRACGRAVRDEVGDELVVMADLCLDEFTDHGHCGVLDADGRVDNDATLVRYRDMAVVLADAGAHCSVRAG
jgi:hypothetical protein